MIRELSRATLLIFLAEMGDKTQILAMALALQFSIRHVLAGVALGSFFNHGLAVVIGAYLSHLIPLETIRLGSAFLFLGFGLWSLIGWEDEDHKAKKSYGHPVLVVALAFFFGELGDKTQLTAIALASNGQFYWAILAGTVLGMVLTSYVGILVGLKLGERIPELGLKLVSSGIFIGFGLYHLAETVPSEFLTAPNISLFLLALLTVILILLVPPLLRLRLGKTQVGQLKRVASTLRILDLALNDLCLGDENCRGERCPLGYCKNLVRQQLAENIHRSSTGRFRIIKPYVKRQQHFDRDKVEHVLQLIEHGNLDPVIYAELKENLQKLINPI